ncbi:outer membrane protein assembly factor BamE [Limnoglobus roseus]|uniref:Outer membrane protein assembly factor BamE n=1 Tax=Limnoglobus roseus TaxID=2598579 RepID=A0A5C1A9I6_9BACT|nr:outer membrane protein assembly factor BamE [Limnoglobus roseus]QEL16029.1 hypothetical protein PX52LOC_02967 [Limnoglobus roseus]
MRSDHQSLSRRRLLRVSLGLLLMAAVGVGIAYSVRPARSMRARFEQVKEGMTREQVIGLVGPPGDYSAGDGWPCPRSSIVYDLDFESWLGNDAELLIEFDDNGVAKDVRVWDVMELPRQTLLERLRNSLGL